MSPADFTIEFYRKCLSQAKWNSSDEQDMKSVILLENVAAEREGEFYHAFVEAYQLNRFAPIYTTHFPVAAQPATETQNTKPNTATTMNTLLKDIYEILIKPLIDAIDRNTAAKGAVYPTCTESVGTGAEAPSEDKPEPKKRGPKAKAADPEAPKVVEAETTPADEEPYLTGPELVELMKPLKDTPYTKKLVEFRDGTLGFSKMTREMSDPAMLRQMEAKIREFLAANEEEKDAA
jgi:hypothetical protein